MKSSSESPSKHRGRGLESLSRRMSIRKCNETNDIELLDDTEQLLREVYYIG